MIRLEEISGELGRQWQSGEIRRCPGSGCLSSWPPAVGVSAVVSKERLVGVCPIARLGMPKEEGHRGLQLGDCGHAIRH